jgi:hypothetical protein
MTVMTFKEIPLPQDPVFLVGYPRSGTTLLQALLATQEGLYSLPETHFFNVIIRTVETDEGGAVRYQCLEQVFDKIFEKMDLRFEPDEIENIRSRAIAGRLIPKDLFEAIVLHYIGKEARIDGKRSRFRWLEKTPHHACFLNQVLSFYPAAKFIYILRHPVPAIYSRKINFPFNKETPVERLARRWNVYLDGATDFSQKHPGKMVFLKYEDLTADVKTELLKLGDFLDLDIDMGAIKNYATRSKEFILASETWKQEDMNGDFSNTNPKYKTLISPEESAEIEKIVEERMARYGYQTFAPYPVKEK